MRTKNITSVFVMLTAIVLLGASCGQKPSGTTAPTDTDQGSIKSTTKSDACGNPYYPFKEGLTIAYGITPTTGAAGDSDYTYRITKVTGTTASISVALASGATVEMSADCASGSVAMNGSSNLGAALEGQKFKTTVLKSSGTFMPPNVSAGTTWSNSEEVEMELTDGSIAGMDKINLTTAEQSKAVSEESITVPAGTYKAMKVELTRTTTSKFIGAPAGFKLPEMPPSVSKSTEWWVKGVGMVKSVTTVDGKTSTTEAKSVSGL
jgi:hypothetical protein